MIRRRIGTSALLIVGITVAFVVIGLFIQAVYLQRGSEPLEPIFMRLQTTEKSIDYEYVDALHEEIEQMGYPNRVVCHCACGATLGDAGELSAGQKLGAIYMRDEKTREGSEFHLEVLLPSSALPMRGYWIWLCGGVGLLVGIAITCLRAVRFRRRKQKMEETI